MRDNPAVEAVDHRTLVPVESLRTRVFFHMAYDKVEFGESLRVIGNHPSIGSWDPDKGLQLETTQETFPCWISKDCVLVELHAVVEYKYVIMTGDGRMKKWEERTANRTFVTSGAEMTIEDDEGRYRQFLDGIEEDEDDDVGGAPLKQKKVSVRDMTRDQKLAFVKELEGDVSIDFHDTIFMISLQLPVKVERKPGGGWTVLSSAPNDGRNFAFLPLLQELRRKQKNRVKCVGWPGVHVDSIREKTEIEEVLQEHDCIPVFPPKQDFEKFVSFYTQFLWPVFHDVMLLFQTSNPRPFNEEGWAAYQHINNFYANATVPHTHGSDLIWIHDYHLMMMPTFISRKLQKANIGFYLHTPFPSSDSFKSLPVREELLSGMLCADQLGFQFFAYARNFLVSCKRIFGLDPTFRAGGFMGLEYNGRLVMIKVAHFVYPFQSTKETLCSSIVEEKSAQMKRLFDGKIVFACMDRCDRLSGLVPKFRAFRRFLNEHKQYRGKAILVQYCFAGASSSDTVSAYLQALQEQVDALLHTGEDGSMQIVKTGDQESCDIYLRAEKMDRTDRLALFRAADVLLDTSVKAGLNLMPFEFITAHFDDTDKKGVVIVSEFSGCSRVLLGSLRVNPWNTTELVAACDRAITMGADERKERLETDLLYASENSPMEWFQDFLSDLRRARKKDGIRIESFGFGARMRHVCVDQDFQKLNIDSVVQSYRAAKNRVFLLDNEGTLAADKRHLYREYGAPKGDVSDLKSHGTPPNEQVLECLRTLCSDRKNTVVILSGRDRSMLEDWFKDVPGIGLAAERGFYYKLPRATGDQWHCMMQDPDSISAWKDHAFEIMRQFKKRTQGSFIENKGSALVWQYRDADQHYGSWQAKELSSHLKELLFGFEVDVMTGKGYVEAKLRGIDKGVAVTNILKKVAQNYGEVHFVLCVGDDRSDEDMFEAVNALLDPGEAPHHDNTSQLSTTDCESDSPSDRDKPATLSTLSRASKSFAGTKTCGGFGSVAGGLAAYAVAEETASSRRFFSCTVGRKPSAANFFLDDTEEVSELLTNLKGCQERAVRLNSKDMNSLSWSSNSRPIGRSKHSSSMPHLASLAFESDFDRGTSD